MSSEQVRDPRDPLVDNTADAQQVKFARRAIRDVEKKRLEIMRRLMNTEDGAQLFLEQLTDAGVFRSSYDAVSHAAMAFNEGQRNAGLRLLSDLFAADAARAAHIFTLAISREANRST